MRNVVGFVAVVGLIAFSAPVQALATPESPGCKMAVTRILSLEQKVSALRAPKAAAERRRENAKAALSLAAEKLEQANGAYKAAVDGGRDKSSLKTLFNALKGAQRENTVARRSLMRVDEVLNKLAKRLTQLLRGRGRSDTAATTACGDAAAFCGQDPSSGNQTTFESLPRLRETGAQVVKVGAC